VIVKQLDNLHWQQRWVSHLGCIQGCLRYLGYSVTDAWLYGATGHAFLLNIHEVVCPSGPTAWHEDRFLELGQNVGYRVERVAGPREGESLPGAQQRAWDLVRASIDEGRPCYGWELDIPEYAVIYGYDERGYYYSGPLAREGRGPVPWQKLGSSEIGVVSVASLKAVEPAEDVVAVTEGLAYALEQARAGNRWTMPRYCMGPGGYDLWISALEQGRALAVGVAYNAAVWAECRRFAAAFLKEAHARLGQRAAGPLSAAVEHYDVVSASLEAVAQHYPFSPGLGERPLPQDDRSRAAIELLRQARDAETAGLEALAVAVERLDPVRAAGQS
jgi:hypothetical protein